MVDLICFDLLVKVILCALRQCAFNRWLTGTGECEREARLYDGAQLSRGGGELGKNVGPAKSSISGR